MAKKPRSPSAAPAQDSAVRLLAESTVPMKDPPAALAAADQARRNGADQRAAAADQGFPMGGKKSASAWDGLQNVVAALGTIGDKRTANAFRPVRPLTRVEVDAMYRGNWVAARVVDAPAHDACREWVTVSWDGQADDEAGVQAMQEAEDAFDLRGKFVEAAKWARLYGGAAIAIGVKGQEDWSAPLDFEQIGKDDLQMLHVVDRWRLSAAGPIDIDPNSKNFGRPLFYNLTEAEETVAQVHWSRLIMFHGKRVPYFEWLRNGRWHDSVLQNLDENVKDYEATRVGIAGLVFNSDLDILGIRNMREMLSTPDGEAELIKRVSLGVRLRSQLRVWLMDAGADGMPNTGEDWQQKTISFSGINDVFERVCMYDVCGAAEIPMTRMFGRSPAGQNATGDSDSRNYDAMLRNYQTTELRQPITELYQLLFRHVTGEVPPEMKITWNPVSQVSATEKATIELQRAQRDTANIASGAVPEHVVARQLFNDRVYPAMEEEDVSLVEELAKEPTPEEIAAAAIAGAGGNKDGAEPGAPPKKTADAE